MLYRIVDGKTATRLIDWAEENDVDWDIWDFFAEPVELGLERWPD